MRKSLEAATAAYAAQLQESEDALAYLLARGISPESIRSFRLGYVERPTSGHDQYAGRIAIPGLGFSDAPYSLRFRSVGGAADGPKYLGLPGAQTRLYNVRAIHSAGDLIAVTEGEFDALILNQCGISAVGVTGSDSWKRHQPRMFAGFRRVFIFGDGDQAGTKFARTVTESLSNATPVILPSGLDVNDLYLAEGQDAMLKLIEEN